VPVERSELALCNVRDFDGAGPTVESLRPGYHLQGGLLRAVAQLRPLAYTAARGRHGRALDRREPQSPHRRLDFSHASEELEKRHLGRGWKNGTWDAGKGGRERGKDYNHSTFCDLVITGLMGLRPRSDDVLRVNPLTPDNWSWFCLDNVLYGRGKGFRVLVDGRTVASSPKPGLLTATLPNDQE